MLHGRVQSTTRDATWGGAPGDHLDIPPVRHALRAVEDAVVLLTVAKIGPPRDAGE